MEEEEQNTQKEVLTPDEFVRQMKEGRLEFAGVEVDGCLDLTSATVKDLENLDLSGTMVRSLNLTGAGVEKLDLTGARVEDLVLTGARVKEVLCEDNLALALQFFLAGSKAHLNTRVCRQLAERLLGDSGK